MTNTIIESCTRYADCSMCPDYYPDAGCCAGADGGPFSDDLEDDGFITVDTDTL